MTARSYAGAMKVALTAMVAGLLATGCSVLPNDSPASTSAPPTASAAPTGASSSDATLTEAMTVLRHYDEVFLQISSDYSVDASLLSPYATAARVDAIRAFQDRLESKGQRLVGSTSYSKAQIQEQEPDTGRVVIIACLDLTGTRLIDGSGQDVTPADRQTSESMQISLRAASDGLKVEESVVWTGASSC